MSDFRISLYYLSNFYCLSSSSLPSPTQSNPTLNLTFTVPTYVLVFCVAFLSAQTGMDFNAKRMKGVFKKYLQFEMEHGDEAGVDAVKAKATEYVASLAS